MPLVCYYDLYKLMYIRVWLLVYVISIPCNEYCLAYKLSLCLEINILAAFKYTGFKLEATSLYSFTSNKCKEKANSLLLVRSHI
jgi:FtsH-binding integral membrane protein